VFSIKFVRPSEESLQLSLQKIVKNGFIRKYSNRIQRKK
jgi:hypothetical protein